MSYFSIIWNTKEKNNEDFKVFTNKETKLQNSETFNSETFNSETVKIINLPYKLVDQETTLLIKHLYLKLIQKMDVT